jgi:hypothetical protein
LSSDDWGFKVEPRPGQELSCGSGKNCLLKRDRRVDIILADPDGPETWIELKSWAAQSETAAGRTKLQQARSKPLAHWSSVSAKGKTAFHRQFSLDRGAHKLGLAWVTKDESGSKELDVTADVDKFAWYFQAFDITNRRTNKREISPKLGTYSDSDSLRGFLAKQPLQQSRGDYLSASKFTFGSDDSIARRAQLRTPTKLLEELARAGFGEVLESLTLDYSGLED